MITIHPVEVKAKRRNVASNASTLTYYDVRNIDKSSLTFEWLELNAAVLRFENSEMLLVGPSSLIKTMVGDEVNDGIVACGLDLNTQVYSNTGDGLHAATVKELLCEALDKTSLDDMPVLNKEKFYSQEALPKDLTTFTISGMTCYADPGMTWEDWVNSPYNTYEFVSTAISDYIENAPYHFSENSVCVWLHASGEAAAIFEPNSAYSVNASAPILPNCNYILTNNWGDKYDFSTRPLITFSIASSTCYAEQGMSWYEWCQSNYNTSDGLEVFPGIFLGCDSQFLCSLDSTVTSDTYNGDFCISMGWVTVNGVIGSDIIEANKEYEVV